MRAGVNFLKLGVIKLWRQRKRKEKATFGIGVQKPWVGLELILRKLFIFYYIFRTYLFLFHGKMIEKLDKQMPTKTPSTLIKTPTTPTKTPTTPTKTPSTPTKTPRTPIKTTTTPAFPFFS